MFGIAFHQGELWKDMRLYLEEVQDLSDKPTINVWVRWVGRRYKALILSLINTGSLNLLTEELS
jgi:hypothetical protein